MIGLLIVSLLGTPPAAGPDAHLGHLDAATRAVLMAKLGAVHEHIEIHKKADAKRRNLPLYRLKVKGRIALTRGPAPPPVGTVRVDTGGSLEFLLQPAVAAPRDIGARVWLVPREGKPHELELGQSKSGSFLLRGTAKRLGFQPGLTEVVFVVGRLSMLPSQLDDVGRGDCQVLRRTVLVVVL